MKRIASVLVMKKNWENPQFREKMTKLNRLPKGEAAFNQVLVKYKSNANKRSLDWQLSEGEFRLLTQGHCWYCGSEPTNSIQLSRRDGRHRFYGDYIHNGIDRLDNNLGYTFYNCVPCCKVCNQAKYTMTVTDFKKWIRNVHKIFVGE